MFHQSAARSPCRISTDVTDLYDETWGENNHAEGKVIFRPGGNELRRGHLQTLLRRGQPGLVVGIELLRCSPAAPRSSVGDGNLSPDDGQELPELQLFGRAGCTTTDRSFVGL